MNARTLGTFVAAALLLAAAGPLPAGAQEAAVQFVSPRHLSTAIGETEIRLEIELPPGLAVERVEILVDGEPLGELTSPPWSLQWFAGDGSSQHSLHAVVHLSDGTRKHAGVRTMPLRINVTEEVDLVNLYVVVKDAAGKYVTDLTQDDFILKESGRQEEIDRFTSERKPLAVAVVLDTSLTMVTRKRMEPARESALKFIEALEEGDQGMLVGFSDRARFIQDLTTDLGALSAAIKTVEAGGGTALYDAVWKAADRLNGQDGRKVMVLLSDGKDEASNGLEPGSLHTLSESLDKALRADVMIFAIGFGKGLDEEWDFYRRRRLADILTLLAERTGGTVLFPKRAGALRKAFEDVADHLRHQYSVAYSSDDKAKDGAWRDIELVTNRPGLQVITRKGYFAPGGPSARGLDSEDETPATAALASD